LLESIVDLEIIALFAWAPQPISGFYIVKSATRLINSGNIHIKTPDAVWTYACTACDASVLRAQYTSMYTHGEVSDGRVILIDRPSYKTLVRQLVFGKLLLVVVENRWINQI
jgi:hypothetical protein